MVMGVESCKIYINFVECYSRNGEFDEVFSVICEMDDKKLELSFFFYGCVLDDVCRMGDVELIDKVFVLMKDDLIVNDQIIERLCEMGKIFVFEMFFYRVCNVGMVCDQIYGCVLKVLFRNGRIKEVVDVYWLICRRGVFLFDESCYNEFVNVFCIDYDDLEEEYELFVDVIKRGFVFSI